MERDRQMTAQCLMGAQLQRSEPGAKRLCPSCLTSLSVEHKKIESAMLRWLRYSGLWRIHEERKKKTKE